MIKCTTTKEGARPQPAVLRGGTGCSSELLAGWEGNTDAVVCFRRSAASSTGERLGDMGKNPKENNTKD